MCQTPIAKKREREMKRILKFIHQEIFGKGPDELWVSIHRNVATYYIGRNFTPMEQFILELPDGEDIMRILYRNMVEHVKPRLTRELEQACDIEILGLTGEILNWGRTVFGAILFSDGCKKGGTEQ